MKSLDKLIKILDVSVFLFILMAIILYLIIFSTIVSAVQNEVRFGLVGEWNNNRGGFNNIKVFNGTDVQEEGETGISYAYCATTSGMVICSVKKAENSNNLIVKEESFFPIRECNSIEISIEEDRNRKKDVYAYITSQNEGLHIINVNDPRFPHFISTFKIPGYAGRGVFVNGNYAYVADVADYHSCFRIIDITSKETPQVVGSCYIPYYAENVFIEGNYAYLTGGYSGVQIIDITSKDTPQIVASCNTHDSAHGVFIDGYYAFVANGYSGLQIIDISSKRTPQIVASCDTPAYAYDVFIDGNYAYMADSSRGLQIIDITNVENPKIVGDYDTSDNATGIFINRNYAYVADGWSGLQIIDITSKQSPKFVISCNTPGSARDVFIDGNYTFVADGGLQIIDITSKEDPEIVGSCDTPGNACGIFIDGNYGYVSDGYSGLQIIDITSKGSPEIVGSCDTPAYATGVFIDGNYAYMADGSSGLQIIDITSKEEPQIVGSCDTPGSAYDVFIDGYYAFVADRSSGLQIIDITSEEEPQIVGSCDTPGSAYGVFIYGNYVYIADWYGGIQIIDITSKEEPQIVGSCDIPDSARDVFIDGYHAFVANGYSGLRIIDITNKEDPKIVGRCITGGVANGVAISGDYAFLANSESGLHIINIRGKENLRIVGGCDTPHNVRDIFIDGKYAYMARGQSGLEIIDISSKENFRIVGSCDTPAHASGVFADGDYAYVADDWSGLQIIDISNKENPLIVGSSYTGVVRGRSRDVFVNGNYAYVADDWGGLKIIDISSKENPLIVGSCFTPGYAYSVFIDSNYAYVADWSGGLQIIDITSKDDPKIVGGCDTPGSVFSVFIDENYAYAADGYSGLQIIDITSKENPKIVGSFDTPGYACGVFLDGNYAYVADDSSGLQIIDISSKRTPLIAGNCNTHYDAEGIFIEGNYAYVTVWSGLLKLQIIKGPILKGNLILVAGGGRDFPDWHAKGNLANRIYKRFLDYGYEVYEIYYFNPIPIQDIDNNGIPNQLVVDDATPKAEDLKYVIKDWLPDQVYSTGPLYICLLGHGAEDRFQIMPNEVISAQEIKTSINRLRNGYTDDEGTYHQGTDRPVVVIIESGASGSFIDDLAYLSNDPNTEDIIVISSTGSGPSYIKPSPDPNTDIPVSFTRFLMDSMQDGGSLEDYRSSLTESFIHAREKLYYTYGHPFLDQAPQIYLPEGPIALTFTPDDPNTSIDTLIITRREKMALYIVARYPDGITITLDPRHLRFLSSQSLVFDPNDPNQMEITSDKILVHPEKNSIRNGLATFITYPDPGYYPNILLTARLPLEVSIPGNTPAGVNKAIIVAGYHTNQGMPDELWEETNTIANHAYKTLLKKGYGRDDIFYFNPYFFQDMDDNKRFDDIDGHPTIENLNWAFAKIADTGAQELLIFLVNHGSKAQFDINPCCEGLNNELLGESILSLAPSVKGNINILIDACHSGSFTLPEDQLFLDQGEDPNDVILITSAGEDESAYFLADGIVSFSYPFFDQYLITNSIRDAFDHARFTIPSSGQTPSLYTPGRAQKRDKALVYFVDDARPVITQTEYSRGEGKISLFVRVYSLLGIKRVWALILSSDKAPSLIDGSPRVDAPVIELSPDDPNAPYGGWYRAEDVKDHYPDAFNYQILICAQDKNDKITTKRTNISNRNRDATGAIILITHPKVTELIPDPEITQEDKEGLIGLFDKQSNQVYRVLKEKGIKEEDIYYLKVPGRYSEVVDDDPDLTNLRDGLPFWLEGKGYDILLIYLLGQGNPASLTGQGEEPASLTGQGEEQPYSSFCLNQKEDLSPEELASYIHTKEGCRVIFFCDIPYAWAFIENLPLEDGWIGISSTKYRNWFRHNGVFLPLFSNLFFSEISFHYPFGHAYVEAVNETRIWYQTRRWYQYPYLHSPDPFGGYEEIRKRLNFYIGSPNASGEDPRLIKTAQAWEDGENIRVELKVKGSAVILPPQAELITPSGGFTQVTLVQDTEDPSLWRCIQEKDQYYNRVFIFVQEADKNGQAGDSDWHKLSITRASQGSEADIYEEDDKPWQAWSVVVDNPAQIHTFHTNEDIDWVYFFGHAGRQYDMRASDSTTCRFIKLSLADPNGRILTTQAGVPIQSPFCSIRWQCPQDGYYLLKAEPASEYSGEGIGYTLSVDENREVSLPEENQASSSTAILGRASIYGRVVNSKQKGINGVRVNLASLGQIMRETWTGSLQNIRGSTLYLLKSNGWYFIPGIEPGDYDLSLTEDDPNIILKQFSNIHLEPDQIERVEDIVSDFPGNWADVLTDFDLVYTQYQNAKGKDYPVWEDKDNDGATNLEEFLDWTDPDDPDMHPTIQWNMSLPGGWSMISLPIKPESPFLSELFPDALVVYEYEKDLGYRRVRETEALEFGRGYWILLKEAKNYTLTGQPLYYYTLSVNGDGWEMIGGCTYEAQVSADNCHIVVIYGYDQEGGYYQVTGSDDPEFGEGLEPGENLEPVEDPESGEHSEHGEDSEPGEDPESGGYQENIKNLESGEDSEPGEDLERSKYPKPGKGYWILLNGIVDQCELKVEAY